MRAIAIMLLAAGCTNDLMTVEFVSASATGVGGHWFLGVERGERIELRFVLDPADISDPEDWSVDIEGPLGITATHGLTGQHTVAAIEVPPSQGGPFSKLEDQAFTFHLRDSHGTARESRRWASTVVDDPLPGRRVWLWAAFWTADGKRVVEGFARCSSNVGVVAYLGGELTNAASLNIDVVDTDLVTSDEPIVSKSFSIVPEQRMYELAVPGVCEDEISDSTFNKIDPAFTVTLLGAAGDELDRVVGDVLE